jgi:hypothetical protein
MIASVGQALTHAIHMIQSSALFGTDLSFSISKQFIGQISTHTLSPLHNSLSTIIVGILVTYPFDAYKPFFKPFRGRQTSIKPYILN